MAAAVLESASIPAFQKPTASPRMAMESWITSSRHRMGLLPEFKGLKVARGADTRSIAVVGGEKGVRRRGVVCEAQDAAVGVPEVTAATWQSAVMECDTPVLVEFWAEWCGPCRAFFPVIDELSKEYTGKLKCLKLNTDHFPDIATKYAVRSIPTSVIFKNGEKKFAVIGPVPKSNLIEFIESFLYP